MGRGRPAVCFLCGLSGATENEHFIPRCFYEDKRVPNDGAGTYSLPAHARCNRSTSRDEEWLAINFALSRPLGGPDGGERWDRAVRALTDPKAAGMKARVLDGMVDLSDGGASLAVGSDRAAWVLAKIAKGLCFRDYGGRVLGADTEWLVRIGSYDEVIAIDYHEKQHLVADVLLAKGVASPEKGLFMWWMILFGLHPHSVFAAPRGWHAARGHGNVGLSLSWPKGA